MKSFLSAAFLIAAILASYAGQAVITSGPNDLTINAGSTANFTVTATNATSYQWTFQGAKMSVATNIAGATNPQYIIEDTATNQAGVYSVIVGGSTGTNATASATLTVLQGTIVNFQITGFRNGNKPLASSNILVELFDHDKPATVQNFVRYITTGAYEDMFFDRLIPGFVLQGGGWWAIHQYASNAIPWDQGQPNSVPTPTVGNIYDYFFSDLFVVPEQVASEFYDGPQVSNIKGTLAMALPSGNVNGGANDFFFNLVDNTNLDTTNTGSGPFTVFGRVLSGENVLDFFNNTNEFSKPSFTNISTTNIFTNGIYDLAYFNSNATSFTDLPLNYHGAKTPANTNLFFVNFTFPNPKAQPLLVTNPPTVAVTFPAVNSVVPNGTSLTILGTAQAVTGNTARTVDGAVVKVPPAEQGDDGVALVYCTLTGLSSPVSSSVTGTTNWSLFCGVLPLGIYQILVDAVDGADNEGPPAPAYYLKQQITVSAVGTSGIGSVSASNTATGGFIGDAIGASLDKGATYTFAAIPGAGQSFLNWTVGTNVYTTPTVTYPMSSNLFVTANFTGRIAFSYPALKGNSTNGDFSIQGGIYGQTNLPLTLQCQLFTFTNQQSPIKTMTATNSIDWSFPVTNLPLGHYFVKVTSTDTAGSNTFITNDFTAGLPVTVSTIGNGRGSITAGFSPQKLVEGQTYYAVEGETYSLKAAPEPGSLFDSWFNGSSYTTEKTWKIVLTPGLANFTATFVSNDFPAAVSSPVTITNPASGAKLTSASIQLAGTINPEVTNPVVRFQLFCASNSVTPPATNVVITSGSRVTKPAWSVGLSNLPPGHYTAVATVSDSTGHSTLISQDFQILARLTLQLSPPGSGSLSSNWTAQYVPVGTACAVTARASGGYVFVNWNNSPVLNDGNPLTNNPLKFTVATNLTVTANFATNYFYGAAGTYHGIFYPTDQNVSAFNSGYYTLTLTSNGGMSLKVGFPAFTNIASTVFPTYNTNGYVGYRFYWNDQNGNFVTNSADLYLTNGTVSGYVDGSLLGSDFYAPLTAFRAATRLTAGSPVIPGTNVFTIQGDYSASSNQPGGDGYASFTVSPGGAATLIGYLADNTSFSQSTQITTNYFSPNVILPFYAPLYGGRGIILGWETNTSPTNFSGQLAWTKPAKAGPYYTNGFAVADDASSASHIPPAKGSRYQIAFGGATLPNGLTNTLTVASDGLFTVDAGQTNDLKLTFTTAGAKTGAVSGSFSYPSGKSDHNFYGAFISPALGGSGYFLDTNSQTGWFKITEIP